MLLGVIVVLAKSSYSHLFDLYDQVTTVYDIVMRATELLCHYANKESCIDLWDSAFTVLDQSIQSHLAAPSLVRGVLITDNLKFFVG